MLFNNLSFFLSIKQLFRARPRQFCPVSNHSLLSCTYCFALIDSKQYFNLCKWNFGNTQKWPKNNTWVEMWRYNREGLSLWLVRLVVARIGSHVEDISLEFLVSQTFITLSSLPDMSSQGISVFQIKLLTLSACFKTFLLFEAVSITTRVQSNVPSAMMLTNYGCH